MCITKKNTQKERLSLVVVAVIIINIAKLRNDTDSTSIFLYYTEKNSPKKVGKYTKILGGKYTTCKIHTIH